MDSKHKQKLLKPKLDRRNAIKNIDYDASTSDDSTTLRTRSLDLSPISSRTSFRIQGSAAEFDQICRSLGLSGPEDFAIPAAAWEARKALSSPNLLPRSRSDPPEKQPVAEEVSREFGTRVRLTDKIEVGNEEDVVIERNNVNGGNAGIGESRFFPRSDNHMDSPAQSGIVNPSDGEEHREIERNKVDGENIGTEESCSSTSNDEDEDSSMTLEPIYGISPNGQFKRTINSWQRGELLGSGSFGTVYEGYTDDGFFFAVKEVSLLDQGSQGKQSIYQLEQEISLLSQFEHENIVRYYGTDKDDSKLYIFLELVTKGSLLSLYQKYDLRESQASAYTRQILNGLKYLHEQNVVHRDIKCANILVDVNGSVKLADFGLAKATKLNDVKSCKGTVFWMAPEVVNRKNKGYGLAADIWSLGCTVLEILTRRPPYSHLEGMQALFRIGKGEPPPVSNSLSSDARDFILKCLQVNPSDRPTAGQLLDHPFVKRPLHTFSGPQSPRTNGIRP